MNPGGGRDYPPVQTGPGAHPASCTMGTGSFPGVQCGRSVLLTTHTLLVPRSCKSRAIPLPPLGHNWACNGVTLLYVPVLSLTFSVLIKSPHFINASFLVLQNDLLHECFPINIYINFSTHAQRTNACSYSIFLCLMFIDILLISVQFFMFFDKSHCSSENCTACQTVARLT